LGQPKIFVGEWATREGSPTTNLRAALGDAAWMPSMERNSDLIILSSYAPLFVNVNPGGMQWQSDLIGYHALSSFGSPSYYAQPLFAKSLGSEAPESTIGGADEKFFYSVTTDQTRGETFLKLVNASTLPQMLQVSLYAPGPIASQATISTLTGKSTSETNSINDPERITPHTGTLRTDGGHFSHTIPPLSIEVIQLKQAPASPDYTFGSYVL
jgi:alpha-N-arabinofuranosidase